MKNNIPVCFPKKESLETHRPNTNDFKLFSAIFHMVKVTGMTDLKLGHNY